MHKTLLLLPFITTAAFAAPTLAAKTTEPSAPNPLNKTPQQKAHAEEAATGDLFRQNDQVFSIHAQFLYWTAREDNLDYALEMQRPAWGDTPSYAQGDYKTATFQWNPGFRIGLSYFRAPHFWEFLAEYTWIESTGHSVAHKPTAAEEFLTGTWPQVFTDDMLSAHSHLKLYYNDVDVTLSRVFFPNPHLRLRVLGGLTAAFFNQDWSINYYGVDTGTDYTKVQNNWDFWGVGFRAGGTVDWFWSTDFYFTGKLSTAVLLGRYHNHAFQKTSFNPGADNPTVPIRDAYYADTRAAYNVQFLLGPSWQKAYTKSRIEVFAGYELNAWFNIQEVFRSTSGTPSAAKETLINSGTLSFDGLTARITVDF